MAAVAATPTVMKAARNAFLRARKSAIAPRTGPRRPTRTTAKELANAKCDRATGSASPAPVARATKNGGKTAVMTVVIQAELATS
jgi:hypothetical protein